MQCVGHLMTHGVADRMVKTWRHRLLSLVSSHSVEYPENYTYKNSVRGTAVGVWHHHLLRHGLSSEDHTDYHRWDSRLMYVIWQPSINHFSPYCWTRLWPAGCVGYSPLLRYSHTIPSRVILTIQAERSFPLSPGIPVLRIHRCSNVIHFLFIFLFLLLFLL